ncbi:Nramp family divalent metal transporter [Paenibacillus endoradicis]|uniref:Nramp family divalent metal transporter n=1 Tax=Paenibacillus endoradicis TaxID=2972487 RepID=UPI002158DAEC|nr:Nramp family divalent metal transporter [Paenibacillus endoradicis]MCR8660409.1 Nramp family divalent metal transporter [Paenibacillus endoradicis]
MSKLDALSQSASHSLDGRSKGIKQLLPFLGPAFIAAVAYIDPGNYATNITAGSKYGYTLLWVILASNLMAVLIQSLSAKLGISTGKNLSEMCREKFTKKTSILLWIQAEVVIMATDLAEFIGAALGIYLLFDLPMLTSAIIAAIGSFAILEIQRKGLRAFEAVITGMVIVVVIAFGAQVFYAKPDSTSILLGLFTPKFEGTESILLSAGMLGATVMPHAIYLHSSLTQKRIVGENEIQRKKIFKFEFIDIIIAMVIAGGINAAMVIVSAALFHNNGLIVEDIDVAYHQFGLMLGPSAAILFGIGLLSAGLSSSSVGTMTGDVVMQGFIKRRIPIYLRRAITMLPPLIIILLGVNPSKALVISQVILSFGIAFALVPLIMFTSNKKIMGELVNLRVTTICAWAISGLVICLNLYLMYKTLLG